MARLLILSLLLLSLIANYLPGSKSQSASPGIDLLDEAFDWPLSTTASPYGDDLEIDTEDDGEIEGGDRRSLFWRRTRYYISYGALSANRIPCPPRSGRSYYTPNCFKAGGPVHPYNRGCSMITRCRR